MLYYSQAGQDKFVLDTLNQKKYGTFVEIGAMHSKHISNTYILENRYFWRGIAVEIVPERAIEYNENRINKCITADATQLNYSRIFDTLHMPERIDYLQIDIEPAYQSLAALRRMPFDKYTFSVITFEHDLYADPKNLKIKQEQQRILLSHGYRLVRENVAVEDQPFEDWWIHD